MKKILILGGTGFVGRILTENLIKENIHPVLFNRGKRSPGIFPELRHITGDRMVKEDIKQIAAESWDVVIDFSCMFPVNLDEITESLKGKAGRYIFVSTCSVYPMDDPEMWKVPVDESTETLPCTEEQKVDPDILPTYGQKKAECERILLAKDWLDTIIFRPGLIYGRYDYTDRFYYWLHRAHSVNPILLPEEGREKFTATYSEDFAALIRSAIDIKSHNKVYNAVTHSPVSLKEYLDESCRQLGTSPEFVNVNMDFIEKNELQPWGDLPAWVGAMELVLDYSKALRDFPVKFHTFNESLKGCIDYYSSLSWKVPVAGLTPEREQELIKIARTV
ncbi:MAG: NAD-dependent epimerase/dehydratase family protein [Ignavibacteria bacterium]|nr:NAD-dependent epimerase/dehydratase family protein [Ignavibacteria bacterium]